VLDELLSHDPEALDVQTGEELAWLRPGLSPRLLRRLRRGQFALTDEIDLHHLREDEARELILDFLDDCRRRDRRCVRIVHGKGQRSRHRPVLKQLTARLLPRVPTVQAFCSARRVDGGTGAVYVLLACD
jgi:DNA-nicking Smr family endonuclease